MTDQTATSGEGSPKTPMVDQTPKETPPRSPGVDSEHSSSSASSMKQALSPLPAEVFLNVLTFLEPDDLARMTRVSSAWRTVINNEPRLWSTLSVALDDNDDMQKASYTCLRACGKNGGRSGAGGIRSLVVRLRYIEDQHGLCGDIIPHEVVQARLQNLFKAVAWASARRRDQPHAIMPFGPPATSASTLRRLVVLLHPNTIASAYALHEIAEWAHEPLFSALREVTVHAALPGLILGDRVLSLFPNVSSLDVTIRMNGRPHQRVPVGEWTWQPRRSVQPVQTLPSLDALHWRNLVVLDLAMPRLPALRTLELKSIRWVGRSFFMLLRIARRTLVTIHFTDLVIEESGDPFEDWVDFVDVRDPEFIDDPVPPLDDHTADVVPAPIRFPALRHLAIKGQTPPLFAPSPSSEVDFDLDVEHFPTPLFVMPALETCDLVETSFDDDLEYVSEISQLAALGANAPQVKQLILNSISIDDLAVCACLSNMCAALTYLDLSESSISDHAILQLPDLVPKLEILDVRLCTEVSCQGVARVVEVVLSRTDSGWSKMKRVYLDSPTDSWADWQAYYWLDFVGVLGRDEFDFEGDGPAKPHERDQWKKTGKRDPHWQERLAWKEEHEMKIKYFAHAAAYPAATGSGSGATSATVTSPFFHHHDAPSHLPQPSILRLPPLPAVLAPPPASSVTYASPARQATYAFPARAEYQPPPVVVPQSVWRNAVPQPHPAQPHPTQRTAEEDGDYSYLDTDGGIDGIDPAVIEAQRAELARLSQRHNNRFVAEAEAYNAQRRRQQEAREVVAPPVGDVVELHPALISAHNGDELAEDEQVDEVLLDAEEEQQPHPQGFAGDSTEDDEDEEVGSTELVEAVDVISRVV
ncbi:hypothetical protein JCM10296v2_000325 [Rhodotorula toruloides]